ncbi:MAG TPA: recombinase family protein [Streptosporangiaceae bacterium]|nr:recombinase family protein [Streptosporangiaceae bacterium]
MRLLPVIRLSLLTENTTSPERQMDKITGYAQGNDHELVPVTEADYDLDVSGAVSPFDRPGLGPWLHEDRLHRWDALVVAKLDRISRSLFDFTALLTWLEAHGKALIVLDPMMDLTRPEGRVMAHMLMTFAEYERQIIGQRVQDAYRKNVVSGKYPGGMVPFGYTVLKVAGGWRYEADPVYGPLVAEMAERYLRYESLGSIARWLQESGIPSPKNVIRQRNGKPLTDTPWTPVAVRIILSGYAILGAVTNAKGPVRDSDGVIVYRAPALVSMDVWERVQARLAQNVKPTRVNTSPLLQVAFCGQCGAPMHATTTRGDTGGRYYNYRYYQCFNAGQRRDKCDARRVKGNPLDEAVHSKLLEVVGHVELTEDKLIPGRDYSEEIARVAERIGHLSTQVAIGKATKRDVSQDQAALDRANAELARLSELEPVAARIEPVRLGKTFAQHWETLETVGRNEFLRAHGVRAEVRPMKPDDPRKAEPLDVNVNVSVVREGGTAPADDASTERFVMIAADGMRITLHLGNLAKLRDRAATVA